MQKQPEKTYPIIPKMAQILMLIETRIQIDADAYLPTQRSRFIDLTTLKLSELEDHFFTYDQIKNLVISMVQRHETGTAKWHIDVENSTADHVAIVIGPGQQRELIPVNLLMAASTGHAPVQVH